MLGRKQKLLGHVLGCAGAWLRHCSAGQSSCAVIEIREIGSTELRIVVWKEIFFSCLGLTVTEINILKKVQKQGLKNIAKKYANKVGMI